MVFSQDAWVQWFTKVLHEKTVLVQMVGDKLTLCRFHKICNYFSFDSVCCVDERHRQVDDRIYCGAYVHLELKEMKRKKL